ncbi:hypothetical protein CMI37_36195 [Candidatus Pacearchaeota archaeon]|nr:hypothetical protein [Candidatus Pacearchaeota archaeon]
MSNFMFGGSALALDIGARAHQALSAGDVVQINPLVGSTDDGMTTQDCIVGTGPVQIAPVGVVLGSSGKSSFVTGEDVLIRVLGIVDAAFAGAVTAGHVAIMTNAARTLTSAGNATWAANSNSVHIVAVAHETLTGAGTAQVYFNGLGSWG